MKCSQDSTELELFTTSFGIISCKLKIVYRSDDIPPLQSRTIILISRIENVLYVQLERIISIGK